STPTSWPRRWSARPPGAYGRPPDGEPSFDPGPAAARLGLGPRALAGEHLLLRALRPPALLAPDARGLPGDLVGRPLPPGGDLVQQQPAGEEAIECLRARFLTFHRDPGRDVPQHDAGGDLVDVLAAASLRAHELLLEVLGAHAERRHAFEQRTLLLRRHGAHGSCLSAGRGEANG